MPDKQIHSSTDYEFGTSFYNQHFLYDKLTYFVHRLMQFNIFGVIGIEIKSIKTVSLRPIFQIDNGTKTVQEELNISIGTKLTYQNLRPSNPIIKPTFQLG